MERDLPLPNPGRVADTDTYDGAVSQLIHLGDGEVLLFYHETDGEHVAPSGRIVVRRSFDYANTWSDPQPVVDLPDTDPSSFSVVHPPDSERVVVFAVAYAFPDQFGYESFPSREFVATHVIESTDNGYSWSDPTPIHGKLSIDTATPFGGSVRTENGLLTIFQSDSHELEGLFSTDGGTSWGGNVSVASSPEGHQLSEPVPCRITPQKIVLFGRDNATGGFYAIKSSDGGRVWEEPLFFAPSGHGPPNPVWVNRTGPNEVTAVWGDRKDNCIYQSSMSARLTWQDPTALTTEPRKRLHNQITTMEKTSYWDGDAGDFGYPTFIQLGPTHEDCLLVCYDGGPRPNLWAMTLY